MRQTWQYAARVGLLAALVTLPACGKSGSNPPVLPEARFEILPHQGGTAQFEIVNVQANGQIYTSLAGTTITTLGRFNVFIENAPGPFGITIRLLGNEPVEVRYGLAGVINDTVITVVDDTSGNPVAVGTVSANPIHGRDSRVDVCSPFPNESYCSAFDGQSVFGALISGSIGDVTATRLVGQTSIDEPEVGTPSVYFWQNAKDSVSAVIRANDNRYTRVQLWIDGNLEDEDASTGNVVVSSDV